MSFSELRARYFDLRETLSRSTGRELIVAISVEEPNDPEDELFFIKLVSWSYVFLVEASQPATRYLASTMRVASPDDHKYFSAVAENVKNLRTYQAHNLSETEKSDQRKRSQAEIWLFRAGGKPLDWSACCKALCVEMTSAIERLIVAWRRITEDDQDRHVAVQDLLTTIDQEWPAHLFDRMVERAAIEIGLEGLDVVKYRKERLEKWRTLGSFFSTRDDARVAVEAAILSEMKLLFGDRVARAS